MIAYLQETDIENCLRFMQLVKQDFAGYQPAEFLQALHNAVAAKEAFISYHNNEVAGLIAFSYQNSEITFLATNPAYRQRGIAKSLLKKVIGCFCPGTRLQVVTFREGDPKGTAAIACYKAAGFVPGELLEVYGYPCQKMVLWL